MSRFTDLFELLRAVQAHKPRKGESITPTCFYKKALVGFNTADSDSPAVYWEMTLEDLQTSCGRYGDYGAELYGRMRFYQSRRELLVDLLAGTINLELQPLEPEASPPKPRSKDNLTLEEFFKFQ